MGKALIEAIGFGLSIWSSKEKTKYLDQFLKLKKEWHEEHDKGRPSRISGMGYSNANLDLIERELCLLAEALAQFGSKDL